MPHANGQTSQDSDATGPVDPAGPSGRGGLKVPSPAAYLPARSKSFRSTHSKALFLMVGVVLLLAALSLWKLSRDVARNPGQVNLGNRAWRVGKSEALAKRADVEPLLFQDLNSADGRILDVRVIHIAKGSWTTVSNVPPGAERTCQLQWSRADHHFTDPCTKKTYPKDGKGLTRFLTKVNDDGEIVVDFNKVVP